MDLAKRLRVAGWVRNLPDGRVEALAEGDGEKLKKLIEFCHIGPRGASVRNVQVEWLDFSGELYGFRIVKSPHTSKEQV